MKDLNIYVGRQPILNRNGDIYAYELLYRNSDQNAFPNVDPAKATIGVLVNTFLSMGVDQVAGQRLVFINFPETLLAQTLFTKLNPDRVVIEVLEDVHISSALIDRLEVFRKAGFRIALDDFIFEERYRKHTRLFKLISFIKVDFLNTSLAERARIENFVQDYPHIALLAEKIESEEEFNEAKKRGYRLFQGYFFAKPEIIKSKEIPSNVALHFHVIQKLSSKNPNIAEISSLIEHDVSLSYKFLRYINSLAFDIPNKIGSIKQAIMLMGIEEAKKWMQVLMLHDLGEGNGKGRTKALVDYSLSRAKLCEMLAKKNGKKNADEYFLAGMFSLIDAIMKRRLEDVLPLLPLSDLVTRTLYGEKTGITPYLQLSEAMEKLNIPAVKERSLEIGINESELAAFTHEVQHWICHFD